jgi:4-hydroxy-3-methylbut-2-enyl diphosphate reductase
MKILVARHLGMCFGVRDAIAQAHQLAQTAPLTILGELVHNPTVRQQLRAHGIQEGSLDQFETETASVMITAHGASDAKRNAWRAAGFQVADGTCPLVRHAHDHLKRLVAEGYAPVVIGQPGHVEVLGLTGDFPEATVIGASIDLSTLPLRNRYGVIAQTTQPIARVRALVAEIQMLHPQSEVRFVDTVCKPTKDRQSALQQLIAEAGTIVVVGGRASNNTRQLVATCQAAGRRVYHIEEPGELDPDAFVGVETVGLTAGTSTLPATIEAVYERLQEISSASENQQTKDQAAI